MNGRNVYAMILAAGRSRRMGRLKQQMSYRGTTMLDAVIDALLESPLDGMVLVLNPELAPQYEENIPDHCYIAVNDDGDSAMIASVRLGLRRLKISVSANPNDGVLVLLADQPQVTAGIISTCAEGYRLPRTPPGILIATYGGRRGHPTLFSVRRLSEIEHWSDDRRLNELARVHPEDVRELRITTAAMPIDVNTPEDYARLTE